MEFEDSGTDPSSTPKLPPLSMAPRLQSPDRSGILTPPLQTLASVPFQWEEEPGKPRPCTSLVPFPINTNTEPKSLELPPRLLIQEAQRTTATKTSSPVTVLEGPYAGLPKFISSSFRLLREQQVSFDSSGSRSPDDERGGHLGAVVLGGKKLPKSGGFLGSWKRNKSTEIKGRGRKEVGSTSFGYPPSSTGGSSSFGSDGQSSNRASNVRKNGSFGNSLSQARSPFWAAVYEGIKQVIPRKSQNSTKDGLI